MCLIADSGCIPEWVARSERYGFNDHFRVVTRADNEAPIRGGTFYRPRSLVPAYARLDSFYRRQEKIYAPGDPVPDGAKVHYGIHTLATAAEAWALARRLDKDYGGPSRHKVIRVQVEAREHIASGPGDSWVELGLTHHAWGAVYVPHSCDVPEPEEPQ